MGFLDFSVAPPAESVVDLSQTNRTTMAPGVLYPIYFRDLLPGDKIHLSLDAVVKAFEMKAPVMGRMKICYECFLAPWSLYMPEFKRNNVYFDARASDLPHVQRSYNPLNTDQSPVGLTHKSSLASYVGLPAKFNLFYPQGLSAAPAPLDINYLRFLVYWDIVSNYYVNTQLNSIPFYGYSAGAGLDDPVRIDVSLSSLQAFLDDAKNRRSGDRLFTTKHNPMSIVDSSMSLWDHMTRPWGGLAVRNFRSDLLSVYLSNTYVNAVQNSAKVNVVNNTFTVDQFNVASKLYKLMNTVGLAGGRFGEWVRATFGVRVDEDLDRPLFLFRKSSDMYFEDVVSTAETTSADNGYLGSVAGRSLGMVRGRPITFTSPTYGTLCVVASLVPEVDYFEGIDPDLLKIYMYDVYNPMMDRIGFQSVPFSWYRALPQRTSPNDATSPWIDMSLLFSRSGGKLPAWMEYRTAYNRLYGEFVDTLQYWTLARKFRPLSSSRNYPFDISTFINPSDYQYMFADPSNENFQMEVRFGVTARRKMSKRLVPRV